MIRPSLSTAFAATALLCACESKIESDRGRNGAGDSPISAEGKAEEGKISVKAPGFDLKFTLPKGMAAEARAERDSKLLYPGAVLRGMAVAAGQGEGQGGDSEVEIGFSTPQPVETVAAWYRDPARAEGFRLDRAAKQGEGWTMSGVQKRDRHRFKLRLSPRSGGGTDGRLTVRHRD